MSSMSKSILVALACGVLACAPDTGQDPQPGNPQPTTNPAAPYVVVGSQPGACLLRYNGSISPTCCYSRGGANACDQGVACNARTGAGCCKIYSTGATTINDGCCVYEGKPIGADRQAACAGLLAGR